MRPTWPPADDDGESDAHGDPPGLRVIPSATSVVDLKRSHRPLWPVLRPEPSGGPALTLTPAGNERAVTDAILDDLAARRPVHDHTDLDALRERLAGGTTVYAGPTPPPTACTSATWCPSCSCADSRTPATARSPSPAGPPA
jgi:hypothetical protein